MLWQCYGCLHGWIGTQMRGNQWSTIQLSHLYNWGEPERDSPSACVLYGWSPCSDICVSVACVKLYVLYLSWETVFYTSVNMFMFMFWLLWIQNCLFVASMIIAYTCEWVNGGKCLCLHVLQWKHTVPSDPIRMYAHALRSPDSAVYEWRCVRPCRWSGTVDMWLRRCVRTWHCWRSVDTLHGPIPPSTCLGGYSLWWNVTATLLSLSPRYNFITLTQ